MGGVQVRRRLGGLKFAAQRGRTTLQLKARNRFSHDQIGSSESDAPLISLTTYGTRVLTVHLAIESIVRGSVPPWRIILWVERRDLDIGIPKSLQRLKDRGLEIRPVDGLGPHSKYFHALRIADFTGRALVTADDDVIYPETWLHGLLAAHEADPDAVVCYRARRMTLDTSGTETEIGRYETWPLVQDARRSPRNFVTGVSGAVYPKQFIKALISRGTDFAEQAPRADDVWLSQTALHNGIDIRVVDGRSVDFTSIRGAQSVGLKHSNVANAANDQQVRATYTDDDIRALRERPEVVPRR